MQSTDGLDVEAFVIVDGDCPTTLDIIDGKAQFRFGNPLRPGLTLVLSEQGLERHLAQCTEALEQLRPHHVSRPADSMRGTATTSLNESGVCP